MNITDFAFDETGYSDTPEYCEFCLGQTVQALIEDNKAELAMLLLPCRLSWRSLNYLDYKVIIELTLHGPINTIRTIKISQEEHDKFSDIWYSFQPNLEIFRETVTLVLGPRMSIQDWCFQVEAIALPNNWRMELSDEARKKGTTNQGLSFPSSKSPVIEYANLRFRSQSEVKIAQIFDSRDVMYFANCTARVDRVGDRVNREPDFLVCHKGKWGILEVDGEPFHPPSRKTQEDERDRLFKTHGVRCIEHYDANRCYQEPTQVVTEFLELLAKNG